MRSIFLVFPNSILVSTTASSDKTASKSFSARLPILIFSKPSLRVVVIVLASIVL